MPRRLLLALLVALAGSCVPPVEVTTTPAHFNPETVMGAIQARGELRIGVPSDRPPFGRASHGIGGPAALGLTADLGAYVADALHVDPVFVPAPNDQLLQMIDDRTVDVAFPITTITEPLVRHYSFTDPYWVAHQRILGFGGLFALEFLTEERVCTFIDPSTEVRLDSLDPDIDTFEVSDPTDCVPGLEKGHPATASDAVLMGMLSELEKPPETGSPSIGGYDLTTEGYGAVVINDAPGFIEVVNNILARAKDDGTWQDTVDKWVAVYDELNRPTEPPELTVEEAAALYPAGT
jgi:ABC-type amino acid transport substrate-binding protein